MPSPARLFPSIRQRSSLFIVWIETLIGLILRSIILCISRSDIFVRVM